MPGKGVEHMLACWLSRVVLASFRVGLAKSLTDERRRGSRRWKHTVRAKSIWQVDFWLAIYDTVTIKRFSVQPHTLQVYSQSQAQSLSLPTSQSPFSIFVSVSFKAKRFVTLHFSQAGSGRVLRKVFARFKCAQMYATYSLSSPMHTHRHTNL